MTENVTVLVVGWCPPTRVNEELSRYYLWQGYGYVEARFPGVSITVISGLTDVGIMCDAYRIAREKGWKIIGVASSKAAELELFPVDEKYIVGENWGDESEFFTNLAVQSDGPFGIINVGGGKQSERETEVIRAAGGFVLLYPLEPS